MNAESVNTTISGGKISKFQSVKLNKRVMYCKAANMDFYQTSGTCGGSTRRRYPKGSTMIVADYSVVFPLLEN